MDILDATALHNFLVGFWAEIAFNWPHTAPQKIGKTYISIWQVWFLFNSDNIKYLIALLAG